MYETGKWSDLQIKTPAYTFHVHKSVVYQGCPSLDVACTRSWIEARMGVIELAEDKTTVEVLLLYLYGQDDDVLQEYEYADSITMGGAVLIAADKVSLTVIFLNAALTTA